MEIGLTYTSTLVVSKDHVAAVMGSGDLHVFATPAMVALMENAAMMAVAEHLPKGSTTVGAMMNTSHVKPSPVDESIKAHSSGGVINTPEKEKATQKHIHECRVVVSKCVTATHWNHVCKIYIYVKMN